MLSRMFLQFPHINAGKKFTVLGMSNGSYENESIAVFLEDCRNPLDITFTTCFGALKELKTCFCFRKTNFCSPFSVLHKLQIRGFYFTSWKLIKHFELSNITLPLILEISICSWNMKLPVRNGEPCIKVDQKSRISMKKIWKISQKYCYFWFYLNYNY